MKFSVGPAMVMAFLAGSVGCGSGEPSEYLDPVGRLLATSESVFERANGEDVWEVVVCRIPLQSTDPLYAMLDDRMERDAVEIARLLQPVTEYFQRWSGGRYEPRFVPASFAVSIQATDTSQQCVEHAFEQSSPSSSGVLVVADAQHAEGSEGGRGGPGARCSGDCSAQTTRRYVYVGASDFMSVWGSEPPLDLIEHELGHGLDWPHSSLSAEGLDDVEYDSPYDLMSNNASAREVDPRLRHGPGILVVNLLATGWIDPARVERWSPDEDSRVVDIVPRSRLTSAESIAVAIPIDAATFASVELVEASGDDAFHVGDFVLVHRIVVIGETGFQRRQHLMSGELREGDEWSGDGFTVRVVRIDAGAARIEISGAA